MGKILADKLHRMDPRAKLGLILLLTLLASIFMYNGLLKPMITDSATNTYYFKLDTTGQNIGVDGTTNTTATRNGKISMATGTYNTSQRVTAAANTNWQTMMTVYGPAYASAQSLSSPAITIGVRDFNSTSNLIYWKASVYAYNPAGTAGNGTLLWSTAGTDEAHPSTQSAKALTFSSPATQVIPAGYRLKVIISCRMTNTASSARFYWGNGTTYSFMRVDEAAIPANTVSVTNLSDYSDAALTSVVLGQADVPMLRFDLSANTTTDWTGGLLDKIGTNANLDDVHFYIYKDSNSNGQFDPGTDTQIGGPYSFTQATGQSYALTTPQALTSTPQRYFVTYDIAPTAATSTTIGARIANNAYVTASSGTVSALTSTSSVTPTINSTGIPVTKTYMVDWNSSGTAIYNTAAVTNSTCLTTTTAGNNLVGLLNIPSHTCTSSTSAYYTYTGTTSSPSFVTLYFNGATGYPAIMTQVKGISFKFRAYASATSTLRVTLFYIKPDGTRVNAPISTTRSLTTTATTYTLSLSGQTFANVPAGSRVGLQIGVNTSAAGTVSRVALGSVVGSQLVVEETAAANTGVYVDDGAAITNGNVYASSTGNLVNSFSLVSPSGNQTVSTVTITGNTTTTGTNVAKVWIYSDNGTTQGALDPGDTPLGSTTTFSGNSATVTINDTVGTSTKRYLVVYDISATPQTSVALTGLVTGLGGVSTTSNTDISSGTLTIQPTTTVTNGTAEPANSVRASGGAAANLDTFGLNINGGADDGISTITVSLLPSGISSKVILLEIVDKNSGTVRGQLSAPSSGDDWRISTTGLAATLAGTECYVRLTPKSNIVNTFPETGVTGTVTAITHLRANNEVVISDTTSATVTIDAKSPTDAVLTAVSGISGGEIDLSWTAATDPTGLHATIPYTLVRGSANGQAPASCSSGTVVYQGTATSKVDTGLSQGQTYAYRVCASDSVNNASTGTTASAVAKVPPVCNRAPSLQINATSQFIKPGEQAQLDVAVNNNDTGACPDTSFTLSIIGEENGTDFITPSTFSVTPLTTSPNGGGATSVLTITSKPTAAQDAVDSFTVRASAPGHPDVDFQIYARVNKYGQMIHSSLTLGTYRFGTWGTTYDCQTCHSYAGTTNIKITNRSIQTPTGSRPVVFTRTTGSSGVTTKVFGNDLRSGTTSQNICEVCHHQTRFHQYSAEKVALKTHNNGKNCMQCHPHRNGFRYSWSGGCSDCHGNPPTSTAEMAYPPTNALGLYAGNVGAHARHDSLMQCATCHSNSNHAFSTNPNRNSRIEIGFSIDNTNFPGFTGSVTTGTFTGSNALSGLYQWSTAAGTTLVQAPDTVTCSVYCHGWSGSGGANSTPSWTGADQVGCGSCHAATGANPPSTGSHPKHAGTAPGSNGIACTTCHGTYSNYSTSAAHINGTVEWKLTAYPSATYQGSNSGSTGALAPSGSYGSCTNLYCHSNVQGAAGAGGPTSYASPAWGSTATCGTCHRDMYSDPAATGGHVQHAQNADTGFDCRICHSSGGSANPNNHANGTIDLAFSGVGANTVYSQGSHTPGNGYGTCSSSNCHGRRTISWGASTATPLCDKCHGSSSTTGFYTTAGPGTSTDSSDPRIGAHFRHITSAQSQYQFSSKIDCSECHVKPAGVYSPGHIDSALPVEINFGTIATSGILYNYTSVPTYSSGDRTCTNTWCHGAGMPSNQGTGAYANTVEDGGTLGTPVTPAWNSPLLTGIAANDCTRCHSYPPPAPNSNYTHFGKTATDCNSCHSNVKPDGTGFLDPSRHVNGIIDGCNSCHGTPPIDLAGLTKPALNALSPGNTGGHNGHILNPNISGCTACHNNYSPQMPSYTLQIGFNGFGGTVTTGTFYGYSTLSNGNVFVSSSVGTTVRRTTNTALLNHCTNLYCHGATLSGGTNTAPDWELGYSQAECGACHGTSSTTYATAGSHSTHAGSANLALACATCHGPKENNYHVNGSVEWHLDTANSRLGANATYRNASSGSTGALAPSAAYGSCGNIYCHSDVQGASGSGSPSSYKTPQWGAANPGCSGCHTDMTTTFTGSHQDHTKAPYSYACSTCHSSAGSGTVKHVNHDIDLSFSGTGTGTVYSKGSAKIPGDGYGSCTTAPCHAPYGTIPETPPTWGASLSGCATCHNGAGAFISYSSPSTLTGPNTGSHSAHMNYSRYVCDKCHTGAVSGTSGGAAHLDGNIDVTSQGYAANVAKHAANSGYTTCTAACHITTTWGLNTLKCTDCHAVAITRTKGNPGTQLAIVTSEFGQAWGHKKSGRGAVTDADCIVCHLEGTYASQKTSQYHADGNIDLRDPDVAGETAITNNSGGAFTFTRYAISYAAGSRTTTLGNTIPEVVTVKFCLKCHDSNGAQNPTARAGAGSTSAMPFGGVALGANYTATNNAIGTQGLIDVATQVAATNSSRHPIGAPNSRAYPYSNRLPVPYNNIGTTRDSNTQSLNTAAPRVKANSVILVCDDCHTTGTSLLDRTITAHGSATGVRGTFFVTGPTLCLACHIAGSNGAYNNTATTAPGGSHGAGSAYGPGTTRPATGMNYCNLCHFSLNTNYASASRPRYAQDVHGFNSMYGTSAGWTTGSANGMRPIAFLRNNISWPSGYSPRPYVATAGGPGQYNLAAGNSQCGGNFAFNVGGSGASCGGESHSTYTPGGSY